MTIQLDLPPEVEGALVQAARRRGMTPEGLALDELRRLVPAPETEVSEDAEETRQQTLREELMKMLSRFEESDAREALSPAAEAAREVYRNNPVAKIVAEKFRRQGLNV